MRKLSVAVAVLVVLGTGIAVAAVGQDDGEVSGGPSALGGPDLEVSALDGRPGDVITIAGGGCDSASTTRSVHLWLVPAAGTVDWDDSYGDPVGILTPDADGDWSTDVTIPAHAVEYRLEAACFDESVPPEGFIYAHLRVDARPVD